ncbi:hypothetical protein [Parasphingorhabdus sp.]|uniref:hypothetical protein n=1 Tax=Parasphingorhabdus sp. TaxID=2709688 RepID=UPI0030025944
MMHMKYLTGLLLAVGGLETVALAQEGAQQETTLEQAGNKVTEPFDGKEVPQKLIDIQDEPYSLNGLRGCAAIIAEVRELNAVLGPDVNETVDKSLGKKREETAARVAGSAVGSIIPFGGLIGEVTGANAERRRYNKAVYAGTVRRGFLKGVGRERGCKAPARP